MRRRSPFDLEKVTESQGGTCGEPTRHFFLRPFSRDKHQNTLPIFRSFSPSGSFRRLAPAGRGPCTYFPFQVPNVAPHVFRRIRQPCRHDKLLLRLPLKIQDLGQFEQFFDRQDRRAWTVGSCPHRVVDPASSRNSCSSADGQQRLPLLLAQTAKQKSKFVQDG